MSRSKANKSGIFLLELLLSILMFAAASTICIQIFAKSHALSAETDRLNHAVGLAQSVAACIQSGAKTPEELQRLYPNGICREGRLMLYLGTDGQTLPAETDASCLLTVIFGNSNPVKADILITHLEENRQVFALAVSVYEPYHLSVDTEDLP